VLPIDESDPVQSAIAIVKELEKHSEELASRERWLVLNKNDLLPEDEQAQHCQSIVDGLNWTGPVYNISAVTGLGTRKLAADIMTHLEHLQQIREAEEAKDRARALKQREASQQNRPEQPAISGSAADTPIKPSDA